MRYLLLLVMVSALVGGTWALWDRFSSGRQDPSFEARVPDAIPEWLYDYGQGRPGPEEDVPPYRTHMWRTSPGLGLADVGVFLGQVATQVQVDLQAKETAAVQVDGVEGQLSYLQIQDFVLPTDRDELGRTVQTWIGRPEGPVYLTIMGERSRGILEGQVIVIQWNRDEMHYVLVGQNREPMNIDILLEMANSMMPLDRDDFPDIEETRPAMSAAWSMGRSLRSGYD